MTSTRFTAHIVVFEVAFQLDDDSRLLVTVQTGN
jgi:hypothetical protein